ncbi:peptidyl-prolyl cis-trans isomerase [Winogradskyella maritima]|uniref:Peptidyl-prolyl cis-trans isomerase n=1 Tax=Winogradskyella maritima TaxID=1517766 RepID=A0ABV8AIB9_9FLAO|nr:peptidyl-prolyl cis-trans isomerase [Winogradskyella maritima]
MRKRVIIIILISLLGYVSCKKDDRSEGAIARVGDNYLYTEDVQNLLPANVSDDDSVQIVTSYINKWASNLLLLDNAKLNLEEDKQARFEQLVNQYKVDLYTKSYLEALVKKNIDTAVNASETEAYFEANKESFKLNDELLRLRYISLPQNAVNLSDLKTRFQRFNSEDKKVLDSISTQFRAYSLNDSIWVRASQVIEKVPALDTGDKDQLLKKSNFIQLKDSLNLYLMQINDVLLRNDYAPLEYVKPSIKQIVINKRKLELIKQLENDIRTDAIKNKQFEVFN